MSAKKSAPKKKEPAPVETVFTPANDPAIFGHDYVPPEK